MDPLVKGGYVMIARQVRYSALWKSLTAAHRLVMIELLLQAQWEDGSVARNGEIIFLKRGQVATSYQMLADDIGEKTITAKVVRTAIDKMERANFLAKDEAVQRAKKGILVTIVRYGFYQDPDSYKGRVLGSDEGKERAEQGQSEGRARAISKEVKEPKAPKNKNPKRAYAENVHLSEPEYQRLVTEYGKELTDQSIEYLSSYKVEKAYKTKDDNLTIRRWVVDAAKKAGNVLPFKQQEKQEKKEREVGLYFRPGS